MTGKGTADMLAAVEADPVLAPYADAILGLRNSVGVGSVEHRLRRPGSTGRVVIRTYALRRSEYATFRVVPRASTKSQPFSIRLSRSTDLYVTAEARRQKRSKGAIVEALTEEAARMRRFPGIGFRDDGPDRRAWLTGTGLDVWEIVMLLRIGRSDDQLVEDHQHLAQASLDLARAYYDSYPDEIDELLAENSRPIDELRELYPFIHAGKRRTGVRS